MAEYKLYGLDGAGQIAGAPEFIRASDDAEAIAHAEARQSTAGAELWRGARLVHIIRPKR
jgi:hypothetical protein